MKKVLLATTALTLSAGVAYAEVSLSGNARMGLQSNDGTTTFEKRMTVDFNGAAETTSGMSFGAHLRLRSNEIAQGFAAVGAARVWMSTNGIELSMGNINGALESMPGMYSASAGLTGLGWGGVLGNTAANGSWGWDAYSSSGSGAEGIEVVYSGGSLTAHLSYSDSDLGSASNRTAAYVSYAMGDWTVAAGMQSDADDATNDKTILTVGGTVGGMSVGVGYADNGGETKLALNGSTTFGATTVSAYVASEESADNNPMGVGISHDLGGASLQGGVARTATGVTRADLGVSFSF